MTPFDEFMALALALPPAAVVTFIFVSAWLEFVFPPYIGDSIMLLGFFLAGQGVVAAHEVFFAAVLGSILGSIVAFLLGERLGAAALDRLSRFHKRKGAVERLQQLLTGHGEKVLLVNRFLPFVRNFMLYGAGAFRLRFLPSMAANAVSVIAFVTFLMALGLMAAGSFEQLRTTFQKVYSVTGAIAFIAVTAWVAWISRRQPASVAAD